MPLPTPTEGELHDEFIRRCMADDTAQTEFEEEDQRQAVCETQWTESQKLDEELDEGGEPKHGKPEQRNAIRPVKIEDVSQKEKSLVWRVSTDTVDRDGEVIQPGGIKLDHFKANPRVLWSHIYEMPPIATAVWTKTTDSDLISKPRFIETYPEFMGTGRDFAMQVFELYANGDMAASSQGFMPLRGKGRPLTEKEIEGRPDWAGAEWIFPVGPKDDPYSIELLEYSAVNVPSNREALQESLKSVGMPQACFHLFGITPLPAFKFRECRAHDAEGPFVNVHNGCGYNEPWERGKDGPCPKCGNPMVEADNLLGADPGGCLVPANMMKVVEPNTRAFTDHDCLTVDGDPCQICNPPEEKAAHEPQQKETITRLGKPVMVPAVEVLEPAAVKPKVQPVEVVSPARVGPKAQPAEVLPAPVIKPKARPVEVLPKPKPEPKLEPVEVLPAPAAPKGAQHAIERQTISVAPPSGQIELLPPSHAPKPQAPEIECVDGPKPQTPKNPNIVVVGDTDEIRRRALAKASGVVTWIIE